MVYYQNRISLPVLYSPEDRTKAGAIQLPAREPDIQRNSRDLYSIFLRIAPQLYFLPTNGIHRKGIARAIHPAVYNRYYGIASNLIK